MKTFFFYIYLVFSIIATVPAMISLKSKKEKMGDKAYMEYCSNVARKFAKKQIRFSNSTFRIEGAENIPKDEAVLFVSNHQSNFDFAFLIAYIDKPKGYIAKIELSRIPILSRWMREINCVFLDRDDMKKSLKSIMEGINILKNGHSLVIFPEGTRSKSSKLGEFKVGSFKLATKSKVPIVPITIDGCYKILEANNNRLKAANIDIYIHPPIYTKDLTSEETVGIPDKVRSIIASKL